MGKIKILDSVHVAKMALRELHMQLPLHKAEEPNRRSEYLKQKSVGIGHHLERIEAQCDTSSFEENIEIIEDEVESIVDKITHVDVTYESEIAVRCVSSYQACKAESESVEDRVLCAVALTICWTKEIIPSTG